MGLMFYKFFIFISKILNKKIMFKKNIESINLTLPYIFYFMIFSVTSSVKNTDIK